MRTRSRLLTALGAALLSLLLVVPALAGRDEERTITVVTDEGETFVCHVSVTIPCCTDASSASTLAGPVTE